MDLPTNIQEAPHAICELQALQVLSARFKAPLFYKENALTSVSLDRKWGGLLGREGHEGSNERACVFSEVRRVVRFIAQHGQYSTTISSFLIIVDIVKSVSMRSHICMISIGWENGPRTYRLHRASLSVQVEIKSPTCIGPRQH